MTLKTKYIVGNLEWEIEIFDNDGGFYGIATNENLSVMGTVQPSVKKALADTQATTRRVWHV